MVVGVRLVAAPFAEGEILLTIIGNNTVGDAIITKTIQDAIDRSSVKTISNFGQDLIVAQGGARLFEGRQDGGFGWSTAAFHTIMRLCRVNYCDLLAITEMFAVSLLLNPKNNYSNDS